MTDFKAFPTLDVLGAATGRLMGDIGGIYEVCSYAAGEDVFTHQLPRVGKEFAAHLKTYRADLLPVFDEAESVTPENYKEIGADWLTRFGETIDVRRMSEDDHERIDAMSELVEKIHPDNIIVVDPAELKGGGA